MYPKAVFGSSAIIPLGQLQVKRLVAPPMTLQPAACRTLREKSRQVVPTPGLGAGLRGREGVQAAQAEQHRLLHVAVAEIGVVAGDCADALAPVAVAAQQFG